MQLPVKQDGQPKEEVFEHDEEGHRGPTGSKSE